MTQPGHPILVTGATGNTGRAIVDALARRGTPVRAMVRSPADRAKLPADVPIAVADFDDPASIAAALAGAERAYLVTPSSERAEEQQRCFADLAVKAGLRHLVVLSQPAAATSPLSTYRPRPSPPACAGSCRPGRSRACSKTMRTIGAARRHRFPRRSPRSPDGRRPTSGSSPATTPRHSPVRPRPPVPDPL